MCIQTTKEVDLESMTIFATLILSNYHRGSDLGYVDARLNQPKICRHLPTKVVILGFFPCGVNPPGCRDIPLELAYLLVSRELGEMNDVSSLVKFVFCETKI